MRGPEVEHNLEATPRWRYRIAKRLLKKAGWTLTGPPPPDKKMVMICAPHTSNWDAYYLILAANCYRVRMRFLFKEDLTPALKPVLMAFGGVPIDRSGNLGLVEQAAQRIREADSILLVLAPAGTRRKTERWKSGFYWIARTADVPLVTGIADYKNKRTGFGERIELTGDIKADMDRIRAAFAGITGQNPELASTMRIKEEDELDALLDDPHGDGGPPVDDAPENTVRT